jgi:hypothetical protein
MSELKQKLESFKTPTYKKVKRSPLTYSLVSVFCERKLALLKDDYLKISSRNDTRDGQTLREIRNSIDYHLRRYQKYCIEERLTAHYIQVKDSKFYDFEHLIPAARIRDLYIGGILNLEQALNSPTVRLSRDDHKLLSSRGLAATTPDLWLPFKRYTILGEVKFQTLAGIQINPDTWTLEDHYNYFQGLLV